MSDACLEDVVRGAVVDRQSDINLRDGHVAHDPVSPGVEDFPVFCVLHVRRFAAEGVAGEVVLEPGIVEGVGGIPFPGVVLGLQLCHYFFIGGDQFALAVGVPLVGDGGVGENAQASQEQEGEQDVGQLPLHGSSSGLSSFQPSGSSWGQSSCHSRRAPFLSGDIVSAISVVFSALSGSGEPAL